MRMIAERAFQALAQSGALRAHALEQAVAADDLLHCQRGGAGGGVAQIGVAMLEEARALFDGAHDALLRHDRADRLVAAAQALGDGDEVGRDAFLFHRVQRAAASHAAHDLIGDQQHAMAVADFADAAEIRGHGRDRAKVAPTTGSATRP